MRCFLALLLLAAGWAVSAGTIELEAGALRVSYQRGDEAVAERSMQVLLEALEEFDALLPAGEDPIHVHIASTLAEFHALTPGFQDVHVAGVARAWKGMIVVKAPQLRRPGEDYRGTLRHELVHVLLYRNVDTAFLPNWLEEGIAMHLAAEVHWEGPLQVARMFVGSRIIPYKDLELAFRAPRDAQQFGDAYAQALSMTRFMRDKLGEEVFWKVILATKEQDFPDALRAHAGISPMDLWEAYQRSLWGIALVGTLVSGSLFTPAAILLMIAYARRRLKDRATLRRWEKEEAAAEGPAVLSWDDLAEDPDAWKGEEDEEEEERQ